MADLNKLQARIRALEARRAKGESVPELDVLYAQMDKMQNEGYKQTTKNLSGEELVKPKPYSKGGSVGSASKRADGCVTKGKTRGKLV